MSQNITHADVKTYINKNGRNILIESKKKKKPTKTTKSRMWDIHVSVVVVFLAYILKKQTNKKDILLQEEDMLLITMIRENK